MHAYGLEATLELLGARLIEVGLLEEQRYPGPYPREKEHEPGTVILWDDWCER